MSRYELFDRSQIRLENLSQRGDDLKIGDCRPLDASQACYQHAEFPAMVEAIIEARANGRPVIAMIGGHPIKLGLSRFLVDLVDRKIITHLATNGAGIIHDYELALGGGTSEDVPKWIKVGQFGLWQQTGRLNDIIADAARRGEGLGEAVGRVIEEECFPHRSISLAAAGWRAGVPVTSHVGIGSDIIHAHANCSGAALGQTSYTDFLIFTRSVAELEGGVLLNIGTSVTGPEVYLKALSMVRNVARQQGRQISRFTTAVFDLVELPKNYRQGPPGKDHPQYYYRPWKTILVRTVADGGQSFYFCGDHQQTIPTLWHECITHQPATAGAVPAASLPVRSGPTEKRDQPPAPKGAIARGSRCQS
jgi:hypothetical protein